MWWESSSRGASNEGAGGGEASGVAWPLLLSLSYLFPPACPLICFCACPTFCFLLQPSAAVSSWSAPQLLLTCTCSCCMEQLYKASGSGGSNVSGVQVPPSLSGCPFPPPRFWPGVSWKEESAHLPQLLCPMWCRSRWGAALGILPCLYQLGVGLLQLGAMGSGCAGSSALLGNNNNGMQIHPSSICSLPAREMGERSWAGTRYRKLSLTNLGYQNCLSPQLPAWVVWYLILRQHFVFSMMNGRGRGRRREGACPGIE